ncbi:hypothetical protein [Reyranella soli]|uniref:hypothetical protein n=1 Tax=Reyranella soli TaxID=1230389 RepID=UPI0011BD6DDE|nr:hypothetical protein [Reyranella soli]
MLSLIFIVAAAAQDIPDECGCKYLKATSTNHGRVCRVQEASGLDCQLRWGPVAGSQVTQRTPFLSKPEELAAAVAGFKTAGPGPKLQAPLDTPAIWARTIETARKYSDLRGSAGPVEELSAFLGEEKLMADFQLEAVLAAITLIDNDLQLAKISRSMRQGLVGALAASLSQDALGVFRSSRQPMFLKQEVPIVVDDKPQNLVVEIVIGRGCIAEHAPERRLASMIKTNWSSRDMRRCAP